MCDLTWLITIFSLTIFFSCASATYIAYIQALSAEQKERLTTTFNFFDKDKSGSIDKAELDSALDKLGKFSKIQKAAIMNDADADKSGTIDFDEFSKFVAPRLLKVPPPVDDIKSAFAVSIIIFDFYCMCAP